MWPKMIHDNRFYWNDHRSINKNEGNIPAWTYSFQFFEAFTRQSRTAVTRKLDFETKSLIHIVSRLSIFNGGLSERVEIPESYVYANWHLNRNIIQVTVRFDSTSPEYEGIFKFVPTKSKNGYGTSLAEFEGLLTIR